MLVHERRDLGSKPHFREKTLSAVLDLLSLGSCNSFIYPQVFTEWHHVAGSVLSAVDVATRANPTPALEKSSEPSGDRPQTHKYKVAGGTSIMSEKQYESQQQRDVS